MTCVEKKSITVAAVIIILLLLFLITNIIPYRQQWHPPIFIAEAG
jgi:hypothetical protein